MARVNSASRMPLTPGWRYKRDHVSTWMSITSLYLEKPSVVLHLTLTRWGWQCILCSFPFQLYLAGLLIFRQWYVGIQLALRSIGARPAFVHVSKVYINLSFRSVHLLSYMTTNLLHVLKLMYIRSFSQTLLTLSLMLSGKEWITWAGRPLRSIRSLDSI